MEDCSVVDVRAYDAYFAAHIPVSALAYLLAFPFNWPMWCLRTGIE